VREAAVRTEGHKYFPEIDGLRAIAVIAVIVNHLAPAVLPSGYLGVDVFFVISGYVISLSLLDRQHLPLSSVIAEFYVRRIKRLGPALALSVMVGAMLIRLFDPAPERSSLTGALALFGLSNLFLYYQAIDYFGPSVELNPFSHTWSLGVEEQFYVLYPLLLLIGGHQGRLGLGFRSTLVGVLSAVSLVGFALVYGRDQPAAYFLLPFRFWELGIGCLLAMLSWHGGDAYRRWVARVAPTLPLVLMIGVLFLPQAMPVIATMLAVTCSALLLMSIRSGTAAYSVLTQRTVVYVGLLSYSLYLWHWIVICLSRWTVGIHPWTAPFQLFAMVVLAATSFHLVEDPLRRRQWFRPRWLTIFTGLAGLTVVSGIVAIGHGYNLPQFSGSYGLNEVVGAAAMPGYRGKYSGRAIDDCDTSSIWSADPPTMEKRLARCTATNPGRPHFVFAGDSHAMDLFPMAELLFEKKLATVTNTYHSACTVPPLVGERAECAHAIPILDSLPDDPAHRSVLVLRNNYSPKAVEGTGSFAPPLETFLDQMKARGYTVVYVAPAPNYYSVGPGSLCSVQWFRPRWALSARCSNGFVEDRGEELARRRDFTAYLRSLAMRRPDLLVFDPFDTLCGAAGRTCTPVRDGELIYRNESHLTERGSELLTDPFVRFLMDHKLLD
jgi:peptidoglycan/LPS O-acetylase OafA/YrhL